MKVSRSQTALRAIPSADRVLNSETLSGILDHAKRESVLAVLREVLAAERVRVRQGGEARALEDIAQEVVRRARFEWFLPPRTVINATGVILHTNLGRAPLSEDALEAIRIAGGYSDLEFDVESGERGSRQAKAAAMLRHLTGAEAAYVAVNNAAAVTLALTALAKGKEVIVSRGEAVEIGGGFRVPVILRQSGARLVEVGTTNRTRINDYEEALTPKSAAILHVHTSNFRVVGFTERPELKSLARLAHEHDLLLLDDNGSGSLLDTAEYGLAHEPTPIDSLRAGVDIVAFSGDKLLGGPQCGILLGRADLVSIIAKHPLARAVRPDKVSLAALAATLLAYLRGDAPETLPVWKMIGQTAEEVERRARKWQRKARDDGLEVEVVTGESPVGGGSLPGEILPTSLIKLPASVTAGALRAGSPPIIGKTSRDHVLLDLRTVLPQEEETLLGAVLRVSAGAG